MSTPPLFFVEHLPASGTVHLIGPDGYHAARVRRIGVGEAVRVADGLGGVADAVVTATLTDGLALQIRSWRAVPRPDPELVVVQAPPKGERALLAVELMTELGVDEIVPWTSSRSEVHWRDGREDKALQRWRRTAREAAKQSRRPRVPAISDPRGTEQVVARLRSAELAVVLDGDAGEALTDLELPDRGQIVVVVGPEGGLAADELDRFTAAGARPAHLGEPVLRTSSAGAAALAVLSARLGRWS